MPKPFGGPRAVLAMAGSLWFAAVLLLLVMVALACATVFEAANGTEQALAVFYGSRWFEVLLALLAANISASLAVRYPFSRGQIGFVVTHVSILFIMAGAIVTKCWAIDGQVGIAEGRTVTQFGVRRDALTITRREDNSTAGVDLDPSIFSGFVRRDHVESPPLALGDLRVEIERYLPDGVEVTRVVDDNPHVQPAVELALSSAGREEPTWVLASRTEPLGPVTAAFRLVPDDEELKRMLAAPSASQPASAGTVGIEYQGTTYRFPVEACMDRAAPVGNTGYSVRVLRYLPHALVGADRQLTSVSSQPVNPAIEAELIGPAGTVKRLAFAKFPEFQTMHGGKQIDDLKLTFHAASSDVPAAPIEVLGGPGGEMYVRFTPAGGDTVATAVRAGTPAPSPWPGLEFTVLRRFDHARLKHGVEPVEPVRKERVPAVLARITTPLGAGQMWLLKQNPLSITAGSAVYEVTFGDKVAPLGFSLKLDQFRIGRYPGERRPRSFESHVTVEDLASGRVQSLVVSMNQPAKYGGYTLYQSSYKQEDGASVSVLSVAWDPGLPVVFTGYIGLTIGMLIVLGIRMAQRGKVSRTPAAGLVTKNP